MQTITEVAKLAKKPVIQYYGKWPFYRLWGIQEPASVAFSIGNGYMHYYYWSVLRREIPVGYQMRPYYLGWVVFGVNSWLWSTVFHTRDFPLTEKLDYFSAGASILYSLFFSTIRVYRVRNRLVISTWTTLCVVCFLAHVSYLSFVHFNYRYNMIANAIVAVLHNLLWLGWSAWQYGAWARAGGRNSSFAWYPAVGVVLISLAMAFEIFDFPPVGGVFDAHSLWHLSTIPLIPIWYQFMIKDTQFEIGVGLTDQKRKT
ncbi:Mn2+ homeostasis protein Per1 [Endogone sp. FLAS-F59071]|nr:Mn2+ homeostasis protein Per1 [Endogone sp. FLAS-F59071]|eukprot:RUS18091.1 Mn2+ homeostasis protein Per1 [Endogone sp. FLAS-F59071]